MKKHIKGVCGHRVSVKTSERRVAIGRYGAWFPKQAIGDPRHVYVEYAYLTPAAARKLARTIIKAADEAQKEKKR